MPKTQGFHILDAQNASISEDKSKNAAGLHPHNVVRRKLADISNQPQNRRLLLIQEKSQSIETTTKEYINQLQKENMALVKMLAQKNEIIQHSGIELDRLRVNLLQMHEQNQQLAIANAQILVELNSGKDRLKMLQHELQCKTGLLKARKMNLEGRETTTAFGDAGAELIKSQKDMKSSKEDIDDEKPHETKKNVQPNGVCPSKQAECEDKTENKRPFKPRQSARFNAAEVKRGEDFFETKETIVSVSQSPDNSVREQGSTSETALVKNEGSRDGSGSRLQSQQLGRSSLSRPSRAAKQKVQSYMELPLSVKLRRPE
ncbi:SHUGOSHIN 2-like [Salvia miltiorrhiza]|uniref:SHUGOSHIN 2-like n=1 Tax=Salvia miltiorrhiza TaxID=226208 RepID=UPI0025AB8165|nr:SHUGOSHIN 2-like [Salvia miltiorrhiza]